MANNSQVGLLAIFFVLSSIRGDFMYKRVSSTFFLLAVLTFAVYATLPTASQAQAQQNYGLRTLAFEGITTTTRSCASFPLANTAHVQLLADVTVVNTSTVTLQGSNNGANFTNLAVLSNSVTADTATVADGNLYTVTLQSVSTCIQVTPTNANPITITAIIYAPNRE